MNANTLVKDFAFLTPEERFRLILAAGGRGDESERDRLVQSGPRITVTMPEHAPYAHALSDLSHLTFIELLEDAAFYLEAFTRSDDAAYDTAAKTSPRDTGADATDKKPAWQRLLDVALAAGFMLKVKADGWKLFCDRLGVPPFSLWQGFPGLDRLQRALALAEKAAFNAEGFRHWFNGVRPAGRREPTAIPSWTADGLADANERAMEQLVLSWGG